MTGTRRKFIKKIATLCSAAFAASGGWLVPFGASAQWPAENFTPGSLADSLQSLFPDRKITDTDQIEIGIPKIAENGTVVPITVKSGLSGVKSVSFLVEKNPVPLAARFDLSPEMDVFISARLKMAESCDVIVIAETEQAVYRAKAWVKVTIGGCGG
ncbi:MAG: thiosulfate oxidation carrier protein SoxY [Gammaproteobacteria bacterium]